MNLIRQARELLAELKASDVETGAHVSDEVAEAVRRVVEEIDAELGGG